MNEELVERVARAISRRYFLGKAHFGHLEGRVQCMVNRYWRNHEKYARDAIEAVGTTSIDDYTIAELVEALVRKSRACRQEEPELEIPTFCAPGG
jgi:hypothetical protein